MHLRCPHCQNPIEIADVPSGGDITCTSCGSSFQLAGVSTVTWDGPTKKRIAKFEILSTIGHGAFGTVLKASDTELDRVVAIKVPRAGNVGSGPQERRDVEAALFGFGPGLEPFLALAKEALPDDADIQRLKSK